LIEVTTKKYINVEAFVIKPVRSFELKV